MAEVANCGKGEGGCEMYKVWFLLCYFCCSSLLSYTATKATSFYSIFFSRCKVTRSVATLFCWIKKWTQGQMKLFGHYCRIEWWETEGGRLYQERWRNEDEEMEMKNKKRILKLRKKELGLSREGKRWNFCKVSLCSQTVILYSFATAKFKCLQ